MEWFNGHVYLGATRYILTLLFERHDALKAWPVVPVTPATGNPYKEFDLRGQIWRYHPPTNAWEKVMVSPVITNPKGIPIPVYYGVRNMGVYQRPGDSDPALYTLSWSPRGGPGARLLRSQDGINFEPLQILIDGMEPNVFSSFRSLASFRGKLYTAPGSISGNANSAGLAAILETHDPLSEQWQKVNETNFGDPHNDATAELIVFNDHLYAGTSNPDGFQLWKTDAAGRPPYRWKQVISQGAGRGPTNKATASMCVFKGCLYIGTAISNGGYCRKYGIGPAACEIIRVYPDDSWELVMGEGRVTRHGLKMPLSGYGPGFDQRANTYLWRMRCHNGWIYAGTFSPVSLLPYLPRQKWPEHKKRLLDRERTSAITDKIGGFDLWRSRDGEHWIPITRNGFGNPFNWGVRSMCSTPFGLVLGVANPYGPDVAVQRVGGKWSYERNPRGGLEVWLGSYDHDVPALGRGHERSPPDVSPCERPNTRDASGVGRDSDDRTELVEAVVSEFWEGTEAQSIGYWKAGTRSPIRASENLVTELLAFAPQHTGRVLELGCSGVAILAHLIKYRPAEDVCGLAFDKRVAKRVSAELPTVQIVYSSSPRLRRQWATFDVVLNVETLSRSSAGLGWVKETINLLKPGGHFVGALVLSSKPWTPLRFWQGRRRQPIATANEFAKLLRSIGFTEVRTFDVTRDTWHPFHEHLAAFLRDKRSRHEIDDAGITEVKSLILGVYQPLDGYILFSARRPGQPLVGTL
jgi:SAM-dependent methyltransferase